MQFELFLTKPHFCDIFHNSINVLPHWYSHIKIFAVYFNKNHMGKPSGEKNHTEMKTSDIPPLLFCREQLQSLLE